MTYIAELSDNHGVIRRQTLRADTLLGAKRKASECFRDAQPDRTLTVLQQCDMQEHVRPLAARLSGDRRRADWVDFA